MKTPWEVGKGARLTDKIAYTSSKGEDLVLGVYLSTGQ